MKKTNAKVFADKGFYIILCFCVAAIGISGFLLFRNSGETNATDPQMYQNVADADIDLEDDMPVSVNDQDQITIPTETDAQDDVDAQDDEDQIVSAIDDSVTVTDNGQKLYANPLGKCEVQKTFSADTLVFDNTMNDWRVHTGTDFKAKIGDRVYAVSDGTITEVYTDGLWGVCVKLDMGNDMQCLYTGLNAKVKVKEGDAVKCGDIVGTVGDSNIAESADESHLHLEMTNAGARMDPLEILPSSDE